MGYISGRRKKKQLEDNERQKSRPADIDLEKLKKAYEELGLIHRQIRESHIEMILNLAISAEYKDPDTGGHILRISDYSTEIARTLGMGEEEVENLRYASPMHDIGKLGIPDAVLQKTGKLNEEEWRVMKTHTLIGARMFQNSKSPLLRAASQIALTHHERFDGSGYPNGTKGKDIPIFGRIVAMVDVFDAVVSKRCYKEKWSFEDGFDYIASLGGTHLDIELVRVFSKIKDRVREIYDANVNIQQYIQDSHDGDMNGLLQLDL